MQIIHYHFELLPSTNGWAKENLKSFPKDQLVVVSCDHQTMGKGQYGREWISPKGENIYASFCFFIDENQQEPLSLTHVLAISSAKILQQCGVRCRIKWPNDLLVEHKKIAGILCETEYFSSLFGVVIGIGLNVNMEKEVLETVGQPATSLFEETGKKWEIPKILALLEKQFVADLSNFLAEGFEPFLPTFRKLTLPAPANHHIL